MKKWTVWAAAAILAGGTVAFLSWKKKESPPRFRKVAVERTDISVTVLATGVVQPQNRLEIKPPIGGRAEEILVEEGESVKKGQVLAWMSSTERAALLDAARAKGEKELAHWKDLYRPTPLIAPLSGVIIARSVEPGQTVTGQDAVLIMSNRLIINAQVDETDIGKISAGQKANLVLDAYPRHPIDGRVNHIAFEAISVSNVSVYEVEVAPAGVPPFMKSGMTANVEFVVAEKADALTLPFEAILTDETGNRVLLPSPMEGERRRVPVEIGLSDGKRIEILSGLDEGQTVLVREFNWSPGGGGADSPAAAFGGRRRR